MASLRKTALWGILGLTGMGAAAIVTAFAMKTSVRPAPDYVPGYHETTIAAPHRTADLQLHVWYPTDATTPSELIAQNALLYGFYGRRDAAPRQVASPVVVLSHGSGGRTSQLSWIAAALAEKGMIVLGVNHPGTTSRDSDPHQTVRIWERPQDMSAVLDAFASGRIHGLTADMDHVASLGFSLGGFSALALAGVQASKADFITYCDAFADKVDCGWFNQAGVDFASIDQTRYEQSHRDPRITATVAIDPALPRAMTAQSMAAVDVPSMIINLGVPANVPEAMRADGVASQITGNHYHAIENAWHFSAIFECSPLGRLIIGLAEEDNICSDQGLRDRRDIQAEAKGLIVPFLVNALIK